MSHDGSIYRGLVDYGAAGLLLVDRAGLIRFANPTAERLLGVGLIDAAFSGRFAKDAQERCAAFISELSRREPDTGSVLFSGEAVRADGSSMLLEVRGISARDAEGTDGIVLTVVDATAWHQREQELVRRSQEDSLTGLPNRAVFADRLRQATRAGLQGTVAVVDLDRFKIVNDQFGHQVGDQVLVLLARRLVKALPESVTVEGSVGMNSRCYSPAPRPKKRAG